MAATQQDGRENVTLGLVRFTGHRLHMTIQTEQYCSPIPTALSSAPIASSQTLPETGEEGIIHLSSQPYDIDPSACQQPCPFTPPFPHRRALAVPASTRACCHRQIRLSPFHPSNTPETARLNSPNFRPQASTVQRGTYTSQTTHPAAPAHLDEAPASTLQ